MKLTSKALTVALAATLGTPAAAQTVDPAADPALVNPAPVSDDEDDDDFPWGLLGLLGLAGLIPRKRRDDDIRVDRTDSTNRPG
jgi:MYXO-CTERM domain-containing protein